MAVRARQPDDEGLLKRGGVKIGYEVFGAYTHEPTLTCVAEKLHAKYWGGDLIPGGVS